MAVYSIFPYISGATMPQQPEAAPKKKPRPDRPGIKLLYLRNSAADLLG